MTLSSTALQLSLLIIVGQLSLVELQCVLYSLPDSTDALQCEHVYTPCDSVSAVLTLSLPSAESDLSRVLTEARIGVQAGGLSQLCLDAFHTFYCHVVYRRCVFVGGEGDNMVPVDGDICESDCRQVIQSDCGAQDWSFLTNVVEGFRESGVIALPPLVQEGNCSQGNEANCVSLQVLNSTTNDCVSPTTATDALTSAPPQTNSNLNRNALILGVCLGVGIPVLSIIVVVAISLCCLYQIHKKHNDESNQVEESRSTNYNKTAFDAQDGKNAPYSRETLMLRASTVYGALLDVNLSPRSGTLAKRIESGTLLKMSPKQRLQNLEFPHGNICIVKDTGKSNFGQIYIGEASGLSVGEISTTVFIKSLRERASSKVRRNFTIEMTWASGFNHVNILSLLAVCTREEPRYMVFEYLEYGALNVFLQSIDSAWLDLDEAFNEVESTCASSANPMLGIDDLTNIGLQVADGMEYLSNRAFVHKDIAARNCQVGQGLRVKISSFGLSYDPESKDYCVLDSTKNTPVPLRWLAPESLRHKKFSLYSDMWSFGVLLWEVFSFGTQPYSEYSNVQVVMNVLNRQLLAKPDNCPESIYKVMTKCWHRSPAKRPDFNHISRALGNAMMNLDPEEFKMFGLERSTPEISRRL